MTKTLATHRMTRKRPGTPAPRTLEAAVINPSPSIVLAEDSELLRETIAQALTQRGCHVRCAADGNEAWELMSDAPFDLLITDNEMPGLHGVELIRRMRASSFVQPTILVSGNMPWGEPDLRELLSPGAAIEKPFGFVQLMASVCVFVVLPSQRGRVTPHFA